MYSSINCELSYKWFTDEGYNIEKLIDHISGKGNNERKLLDKIVNNGQNISFDLGYDISSYFFQVKVVLLGTQKDSDIPAKYEKTYNIKYEAEDTYPPNLECSDMLRTSDMNELYGTEENWSEDYVVVTAKDLYMGTGDDSDKIYSTGLKCFELYVNGEKTAVFNPEELKQVSAHSYVLPLYGRFVDFDNEKAVFKIIAYDNNNNAVERETTKASRKQSKYEYGEIMDLTCLNGICKFRLRHYDYDHAKVHLYKWEDNQWVLTDSFRPVNESAYVYNELLPFNTIKLSSDGFYKLLSEYTYYKNGYYESITHEYYEHIYWYFNSPCILSTLTKSSGSYDFILKNGSSISSVVVSSDQPVFVYTLVTVKDYATCSTWDTATWESKFLKHVGDTVLDFSPSDHSPKRYTIPLDSIHDGECYVVIAHFADGSTAMSEVMQRYSVNSP